MRLISKPEDISFIFYSSCDVFIEVKNVEYCSLFSGRGDHQGSELFEQLEVVLPDSLGHVDVVLLVEVEISRVLVTGHHGNHRGGQLPLTHVLPAGL